jgi:hypothetical protein
MFIGHFALGFAAKPLTPRVGLAVLFGAAQLVDVLWPIFVGLGLEHVRIDPGNTRVTPFDFISYPYSHSLVAMLIWGVLAGALATRRFSDRHVFLVIGGLVVSHWFLDFISHRPDMPIYPGSAKFGLSLWNSVAATVIVETLMYVTGVWIYIRATRARDAVGRWGFAAFALFVFVMYVVNLVSPPPPSVTAVWISAIAGAAILFAWAAWFDRHRDVRLPSR